MESNFRISSELRSQRQSRIPSRALCPDTEISMKQEISDFYDMEMSQRQLDNDRDEEMRSLYEASVHLRC
jgi:hypothetical protein